ncbi:MAG: acyl-CoA dehydrogenase family protein [Dehalococcoidia bacterium]
MQSLGESVHALAPLIREHAATAERDRSLTPEVVAALKQAGFQRMLVPAAYGGLEIPAPEFLRAVEALSIADGATGWVANIWSTTGSMAWFLSPDWAEPIFRDPLAAYAGAFAPAGKGTKVDGGWQVTGRWQWGSGSQHASWLTGGTICDDGLHLAFFPVADVRFIDTWHASGLRATGSNDFEVTNAFVPEGREVAVGRVGPQIEGPLGAFPNFTLLALGVAAVCLGIGRRAIDEIESLATTKKPGGSTRTLAEQVPAQLNIGTAEARLASARAYMLDETERAWEAVARGARLSTESRARLRLAAAHAAREAAAATDLAYSTGGGTSVFESSVLQRCFRDIHTATAHGMLGDRFITAYSRIRLGLDSGVPFL